MKVSPEFRRLQLRSKQQNDVSVALMPAGESSMPTPSASTAAEVAKSPQQAADTVPSSRSFVKKTPIEHFQEIAQPRRTQAVSQSMNLKELNGQLKYAKKQQQPQAKPKQQYETKTKTKKRIVCNVYNTQYTVVGTAAKNLGFKTVDRDHMLAPNAEFKQQYQAAWGPYAAIQADELDLVWFDLVVKADVIQKLKAYQRISQWPGISVLSHKNIMATNLMLMKKHQPKHYDFFPTTYMLPADMNEFKKEFKKKQPDTFIVKPSHDCQGRGIYLLKDLDDIQDPEQSVVAQTYLDNPFLVDNLKFDLRIYVLLYGVNPLKIYLFEDGLARFATTPYRSAKESDITDLFMHLTNYSINKKASTFVQNQNEDGSTAPGETSAPCHKRSLKEIYKILEGEGLSTQELKDNIEGLIVKTIITGQNYMNHIFRECQPDDYENQMCFQILGFDVMIDDKLKPWLIEINQSPSFATDSAFDLSLKLKLVQNTFALLNLSPERKQWYLEEKERQYFQRMLGGPKIFKLSYEEKVRKRMDLDRERDKIEKPILEKSGYTRIFPIEDEEKMNQYNSFLKLAKDLQDQFTLGKVRPQVDLKTADYLIDIQKQKAKSDQQAALKARLDDRPKTAVVRDISKRRAPELQNKLKTPDKTTSKKIWDNRTGQKDQAEIKIKAEIQKGNSIRDQVKELVAQQALERLLQEEEKKKLKVPEQNNQDKQKTPIKQTSIKSQVDRQSKGESKPMNQKAVKPGHQMDVSPRPTFENHSTNLLRINDDAKKPQAVVQRGKEIIKTSKIEKGTQLKDFITPVLGSRKANASVARGKSRNTHERPVSSANNEYANSENQGTKRVSLAIVSAGRPQLERRDRRERNQKTREQPDDALVTNAYQNQSTEIGQDQDTALPEDQKPLAKNVQREKSTPTLFRNKYVPLHRRKRAQHSTARDQNEQKDKEKEEFPTEYKSMTPLQRRSKPLEGQKSGDFQNQKSKNQDKENIDQSSKLEKEEPVEDKSDNQEQSISLEKVQIPHALIRLGSARGSPRRELVGIAHLSNLIEKDQEKLDKYAEQRKKTIDKRNKVRESYLNKRVIRQNEESKQELTFGASPNQESETIDEKMQQQQLQPQMQDNQGLPKWTESVSDNRSDKAPIMNQSKAAIEVQAPTVDDEDDPQSEMAAAEMPPNPIDLSQVEAPVMAEPSRPEPSESKLDDNVEEQQESSEMQSIQVSINEDHEMTTQQKDEISSIENAEIQESLDQQFDNVLVFNSVVKQFDTVVFQPDEGDVEVARPPPSSLSTQQLPKFQRSMVPVKTNPYLDLVEQTQESSPAKSIASEGNQSNRQKAELSLSHYVVDYQIMPKEKTPKKEREIIAIEVAEVKRKSNVTYAQNQKEIIDESVNKAIKLNATVRRVEELWRKTKKMQNDNQNKQVSPVRPPRPLLEPKRKAEESYKSAKVNEKYQEVNQTKQVENFKKIENTAFLYKKTEKQCLETTPKPNKNSKLNEDILKSPTTPAPTRTSKFETNTPLKHNQEASQAPENGPRPLLSPKANTASETNQFLSYQEQTAKRLKTIQKQNELKLVFIKIIEDRKAKGKDPVFSLKDDFAIHQQIGQGAYAIIKKCTHRDSGYKVALKTYEKKQLTKKSQLMAIHREIYILAGMDHPNIMRLYEVIDTKNHVHLAMELCPGLALNEFTAQNSKAVKMRNGMKGAFLDERLARDIFKQISSAVAYVHSLELVHRNLKINQIIVIPETKVIKFTDFGFATSFQQNDTLQAIGGTPSLENPTERTSSGQAADVRQLGIILYIMLTGGAPSWSEPEEQVGFNTYISELHTIPLVQNLNTNQLYQMYSPDVQSLLKIIFSGEVSSDEIMSHPWLLCE